MKYGRLTIIKEFSQLKGKYRRRCYLCRCDCGKEIICDKYKVKTGHTKSCGCYKLEKQRLPEGQSALNNLYYQYQTKMAKNRGWVFEITKKDFSVMIKKNCHYCGVKPKQEKNSKNGTLLYNGIDRLNTYIGYVKGNVVPCCGFCNKLKSNLLSEEEMKVVVEALKKHRSKSKVAQWAYESL